MEKKITERERLERIIEIMETVEVDDKDDIITYAKGKIEKLNARAEKAKEARAKKAKENDAITEAILAIMTDEYKSIPEIIEAVGIEDLTPAKVSARMKTLVQNEIVDKTQKSESGRRFMVYKLKSEEDTVEE